MHPLSNSERIHYRDLLREARYGALADAEGFQQVCFAIEALGKRLNPRANGLGSCYSKLRDLVNDAGLLGPQGEVGGVDKRFDAFFIALRDARNDIAHTGAYARNVAIDAVSLCSVLEDALMHMRATVADFMVSTPIMIQPWQSIGFARQLMLLNSFSYLPVWHQKKWWLLSDIALAKYLRPAWPARKRMQETIEEANKHVVLLAEILPIDATTPIDNILKDSQPPGLWLVVKNGYPEGHLAGVLSPFELM
ncbi:hypothetical protein [Limnohabitans sp.]|uniref:hypothetical protein n=1 Tax=Limnohabitans sp. TaxID=1907725 RepID=UPI003340B35C